MAYADAIREQAYESGIAVVGSFASGAEVYWGTRAAQIASLSAPLDPRVLAASGFSHGVGETWDAELERPGVDLDLDNSDGALTPYVLGCAVTDPATSELSGDSFLDFRASILHWVRGADGSIYTTTIAARLYCAGGVTDVDNVVRLRLEPRGVGDLDRSVYGTITIRHLLDSLAGANGNGTVSDQYEHFTSGFRDVSVGSYRSGALTQGTFTAMLESFEGGENLEPDRVVPFIFGRNAFRTMPLGRSSGAAFSIVGLCKTEPTISNPGRWNARPADGVASPAADGYGYALGALGRIARDVLCDDGTTRTVWIVFYWGGQIGQRDDGAVRFDGSAPDYLIPAPGDEIGGTDAAAGPAALVKRIVSDLGPGAATLEASDFSKAIAAQAQAHAGRWGGAIYGSMDLAEPISVIAASGHLAVWIDPNGKIRCLAYPGFGADEVSSAAGALPIIRDSDVLSEVETTIPLRGDDRGAACSYVAIEWSEEQRETFPMHLRTDRVLGGYRPSSRGFEIPATLRGDWIYPPGSRRVLNAAAIHRARFLRRLTMTTRLWVGTAYTVPQLFRLTISRGRAGSGIEDRLVRLEYAAPDPLSDSCLCRFEDLGPIADLRSVVLDDEANWIRFNPSDGTPADSITITSGSAAVVANNWDPAASGVVVGDHLWVWGAANAANRKSVRITGGITAGGFNVEANFSATETVVCSAAGTALVDRAWIVMKTQATKSPTNTTKMTVCDETDSQFRDGSAGFVVGG